MENDTLVILPTYNEIENIEIVLHEIFVLSFPFHVLVVDDDSPDGTSQKVKELADGRYSEKLFLILRKKNRGLGPSYIEGFKWGLEKGYEYVCQMDADLSHNPKDLLKLRKKAESKGNFIIGSRYLHGVNVINWPLNRILISYFGTAFVNFILKLGVKDATAGFSCIQMGVLKANDFEKIGVNDYGFQIELKYRSKIKGFQLCEESIVFKNREKGKSKMNSKIIFNALINVFRLVIKKMLGQL